MREVVLLNRDQRDSLTAMLWWMPLVCFLLLLFFGWALVRRGTYFPFIYVRTYIAVADFSVFLMAWMVLYGRYLAANIVTRIVLSGDLLSCELINGKQRVVRWPARATEQKLDRPFLNLSPMNPEDRLVCVRAVDGHVVFIPSKKVEQIERWLEADGEVKPS